MLKRRKYFTKFNDPLNVYYAHHLWIYNTEIEKYELSLIKNYFPYANIINPNGHIPQCQDENIIMKKCLNKINISDVIVFSSINGVIGKGVYKEINEGLNNGKLIYYIYNNCLYDARGYNFLQIKHSNNNKIYAKVLNN